MKRHLRDKVICEVPGCPRVAKFNSPGDWCNIHWRQ